MSDDNWNFDDLKRWDDIICQKAESFGLDWHPINYEICDYFEMIGHMSYHGMPSHYNHWSYGKSFEVTHQRYNAGMSGLPYELIINSNPSIAYLMRENPLYLQILIMAHCVGHSDFFKNNRTFRKTGPETIVSKMRNAKRRIFEYSEDQMIGKDKVENFLDALHSVRFQTERYELPRLTPREKQKNFIDKINNSKLLKNADPDKRKRYERLVGKKWLIGNDYDLLGFFLDYGDFDDWQLDLINIVRDESHYFIPQIKTKILNEGWASFWHYKILHELELPQKYHIPFLKMHNAVVRPHIGGVNPYHLGFYLFQKIEREMGLEECFFIREVHDDASALRAYLDEEDMVELNFFEHQRDQKTGDTFITEVSDKDGWKKVKQELIRNTGVASIPLIYVSEVNKKLNLLELKHEHDGRDLELNYAEEVVKNIKHIWDGEVKLFTVIEEEIWEI
tara:strand:+ start:1164 stop:2510 length:1347 start_codon:yes stop_codon:yes gene_type:complete